MNKEPFLPFREFADKRIENNARNSLYTDMPLYLRDFVALVVCQNHSGASIRIFLSLVTQLMRDYWNQFEDRT
jgi:hypothetical protein